MKAKDIRELSAEEIEQRVHDEKQQLSHMEFQHAIAELPNPMVLRHKRRFIAQLATVLAEKKQAEA